MGGFTQWAGRQKGGGDGHRAPAPANANASRGGGSSRREPTPKGGGRQCAPDDWSRGGGSSRREPTPRGRGRQAHHGKGGRRARSPAESLETKARACASGTASLASAALSSAEATSDARRPEVGVLVLRGVVAERAPSGPDWPGRPGLTTRQPGYLRALQGHSDGLWARLGLHGCSHGRKHR